MYNKFSLLLQAQQLQARARETYPPTAKIKTDAQSVLDLLENVYAELTGKSSIALYFFISFRSHYM